MTVKGDYEVGYGKPPKNRQFGQPEGNPRHSGAWKKQDTARFKLERMLTMNKKEIAEILASNDEETSFFEQKLAQAINNADWKTIEGMMNQVYGQPKATVKHEGFFVDPEINFESVPNRDESKATPEE